MGNAMATTTTTHSHSDACSESGALKQGVPPPATSEVAWTFAQSHQDENPCFMGIQMNMATEHYSKYWPLLMNCNNNLGDPFTAKAAYAHSFGEEIKLIALLAEMFGMAPSDAWGYMTHGSSGSNLHGIYNGRRVLGDDPTKIALLCASDAHYCITKASDLVGIKRLYPVPTDPDGRMCVEALKVILTEHLSTKPQTKFLLVCCSGAVRTGAIDNVNALMQVFELLGIRRDNMYVHLDAALGGMITPFLDYESDPKIPDHYKDAIIANPNVDSQSTSFHKRLGLPFPASVFMTKLSVLSRMPCPLYAECAGTFDTTLDGSRNGMIPFMVYHELRAIGNSAMRQRLKACLEVADYMVEKLTKLRGTEERRAAELKFAPWHPPGVMCVCVSPPPQQMCAKYHLPVFRVQGQVQMTHILTMEHLTKTSVDTFVDEWDAYLVAQKEKDNSKRPSAGGDAWGAVIRRSLTPTGSKFGKINVVGFGTYKLSGDDCAQAVGVAQNTGYSLMDTATVYKNLRLVGELESRVQICHKIDHHITTGRELAEQFEKDLGELGNLSSVHVLMLHYFPKEDCNRQDIWLALLNEKRQGRTKFAGVSNFTIENLQLMFGSKHGDEWPDVVQVHVSVCTQKFIEFCSNMSIDIMVYGVMQNGILEAAKGLLEQGLGVLVSSTRPANIRKNFETLAEYVG